MLAIGNLGMAAKALIAVYAGGITAHSLWSANRGGALEVTSFNKASGSGQEVGFVSAFEAFWSGVKWNTFWTFLDSCVWPLKFVAFMAYLVQSQYTPQRLGTEE